MSKVMGNTEGEPSTPYPSEAYAWSVVAILIFAYTISFVDRQIMSLLIQPIKADLQINDTLIGLLHGLAFAVVLYDIRHSDRAHGRQQES